MEATPNRVKEAHKRGAGEGKTPAKPKNKNVSNMNARGEVVGKLHVLQSRDDISKLQPRRTKALRDSGGKKRKSGDVDDDGGAAEMARLRANQMPKDGASDIR